MRKIVLLPDPLGPSRPTISPCAMANDTSVTARRGPYDFVTCCASTTGDIKTHKTQIPEEARRPVLEHDPGHDARDPHPFTHPRRRAITRNIRESACAL